MTMSLDRVSRAGRRFAFLALALAALAAVPARGQDMNPDTVIATLDGEPITNADLAAVAAEFADQISRVPPERQPAAILDLVINIRLTSKAAVAAGVDQRPEVIKRLDLARDRTLYSEFLREKFIAAVTDEAVRARFDEMMANFKPADEVRARHILVNSEDEAKAIIAELDAGGDFATIAAAKSIDGSGQSGGDLGWFKRGQMVKPFEDAAFALNPGEYTKAPVQSNFGWHVILVEEKRQEPPPVFEAEAQRIQQELVAETFEKEINALRDAAKIEIVGAPPAPETPPPAEPPPPETPEAE